MAKTTKNLTLSEKFILLAQTGLPVLIQGMPGEAKTAYIQALAIATKRHLETVIASIRDASEIGGLPVDRPEGIILHPPAWANRLVAAAERGGILFFDEITCTMPSGQAALLRVIHEKVVGELTLPSTTWMIAAANPPEVAANGWELSPPMANRFIHLNWEVNTNDWMDGMINGFQPPAVKTIPSNWRDSIPGARALIASFIRVRPALLRGFPKDSADRAGAWPSPRTWDMAASVYAAFEAAGEDPLQGIAACVGDSAAKEFAAYVSNLDLPDPEDLLRDPSNIVWPDKRDDKAFAMITSVVSAVIARNQPKRWEASWKVLSSANRAGKADLVVIVCKTLLKNKPAGATQPVTELAELAEILKRAGAFELKQP